MPALSLTFCAYTGSWPFQAEQRHQHISTGSPEPLSQGNGTPAEGDWPWRSLASWDLRRKESGVLGPPIQFSLEVGVEQRCPRASTSGIQPSPSSEKRQGAKWTRTKKYHYGWWREHKLRHRLSLLLPKACAIHLKSMKKLMQ